MNYKAYNEIKLSTLGLGNMRLPLVNPDDPKSPIDYKGAHEIIDYAMANGINYYDTAWVYNDGDSEKCLGEGIKKYPRDSYYLATKYNIGAGVPYEEVFEEQLSRLHTDHIDFYLIHCILDGNVDDYLSNGCIEYFLEQKAKGRIRYLGFSSHAGLEALTKFADYRQWDFGQLQINYMDWQYGTAAEEYKILTERNIPVIVMEPVRGGALASLNAEAQAVLREAHPDWSDAEWAFRFVQSLDNVKVILSGMSNMEQISENIRVFSGDEGLTEADKESLMKACEIYRNRFRVPCTACCYCTSGCPASINIPEIMKIYNTWKTEGEDGIKEALEGVKSEGRPTDCISCGACTSHCPQSIAIPDIMSELGEKFGI